MNIFVKICGITRISDAEFAVSAGVDALGFIAWPKSRRFVTPEKTAELISVIPCGIRKVGVFVDADADWIRQYLHAGIDTVQLHGHENPELACELNTQASIWKAFRPRQRRDVEAVRDFPAEFFLLDAFSRTAPGGTGNLADWEIANFAKELLPHPLILAGGLAPENLAEAWRCVSPRGFDVSSGVEDKPGVKNHARIEKFLQISRRLALES